MGACGSKSALEGEKKSTSSGPTASSPTTPRKAQARRKSVDQAARPVDLPRKSGGGLSTGDKDKESAYHTEARALLAEGLAPRLLAKRLQELATKHGIDARSSEDDLTGRTRGDSNRDNATPRRRSIGDSPAPMRTSGGVGSASAPQTRVAERRGSKDNTTSPKGVDNLFTMQMSTYTAKQQQGAGRRGSKGDLDFLENTAGVPAELLAIDSFDDQAKNARGGGGMARRSEGDGGKGGRRGTPVNSAGDSYGDGSPMRTDRQGRRSDDGRRGSVKSVKDVVEKNKPKESKDKDKGKEKETNKEGMGGAIGEAGRRWLGLEGAVPEPPVSIREIMMSEDDPAGRMDGKDGKGGRESGYLKAKTEAILAERHRMQQQQQHQQGHGQQEQFNQTGLQRRGSYDAGTGHLTGGAGGRPRRPSDAGRTGGVEGAVRGGERRDSKDYHHGGSGATKGETRRRNSLPPTIGGMEAVHAIYGLPAPNVREKEIQAEKERQRAMEKEQERLQKRGVVQGYEYDTPEAAKRDALVADKYVNTTGRRGSTGSGVGGDGTALRRGSIEGGRLSQTGSAAPMARRPSLPHAATLGAYTYINHPNHPYTNTTASSAGQGTEMTGPGFVLPGSTTADHLANLSREERQRLVDSVLGRRGSTTSDSPAHQRAVNAVVAAAMGKTKVVTPAPLPLSPTARRASLGGVSTPPQAHTTSSPMSPSSSSSFFTAPLVPNASHTQTTTLTSPPSYDSPSTPRHSTPHGLRTITRATSLGATGSPAPLTTSGSFQGSPRLAPTTNPTTTTAAPSTPSAPTSTPLPKRHLNLTINPADMGNLDDDDDDDDTAPIQTMGIGHTPTHNQPHNQPHNQQHHQQRQQQGMTTPSAYSSRRTGSPAPQRMITGSPRSGHPITPRGSASHGTGNNVGLSSSPSTGLDRGSGSQELVYQGLVLKVDTQKRRRSSTGLLNKDVFGMVNSI